MITMAFSFMAKVRRWYNGLLATGVTLGHAATHLSRAIFGKMLGIIAKRRAGQFSRCKNFNLRFDKASIINAASADASRSRAIGRESK